MIGLTQKPLSSSKQLHLLIVLGCLATIPGCSCSRDRETPRPSEQETKEQKTKESKKSTESAEAQQASGSEQQESSSGSGSKNESSTTEGSAKNPDSTSPESSSASSSAKQGTSPVAGKSASNHAGSGLGSGKSSAPSGSTREQTTPAQALARAEKLSGSAETHAGNGNYGKAYAASLEAWQSLQSHPEDKACQAMASELIVAMKHYGERTNRSNVQTIKNTSRKLLKVE